MTHLGREEGEYKTRSEAFWWTTALTVHYIEHWQ